jgi:hypothetical protein
MSSTYVEEERERGKVNHKFRIWIRFPGPSRNNDPIRQFLRGCLARPERFELSTFGFGDQRSIQLSYGRVPTVCTRASFRRPRE